MNINQIIVGTPVIYWGYKGPNGELGEPLKTEIRSDVWALGSGELVCKVNGKSGGVAISHLDPITPGSLMAAKLHGLREITDYDLKQSSEKFFSDRGLSVSVNVNTNPT